MRIFIPTVTVYKSRTDTPMMRVKSEADLNKLLEGTQHIIKEISEKSFRKMFFPTTSNRTENSVIHSEKGVAVLDAELEVSDISDVISVKTPENPIWQAEGSGVEFKPEALAKIKANRAEQTKQMRQAEKADKAHAAAKVKKTEAKRLAALRDKPQKIPTQQELQIDRVYVKAAENRNSRLSRFVRWFRSLFRFNHYITL